jgi:hypothetical protein
MSCDELVLWIREFLFNPAFGWPNSKLALVRYLGIDLQGLKSKVRKVAPKRFVGGAAPVHPEDSTLVCRRGRSVANRVRSLLDTTHHQSTQTLSGLRLIVFSLPPGILGY